MKTQRAWTDYNVWAARADRDLIDELGRIDEDMNDRGLYNSGIRLDALGKARQRATDANADQLRTRARKIDDAFHKLRRVDLAWMAIQYREKGKPLVALKGVWRALTKPPLSMEKDMLDPVLRRLEEGEEGGGG